MLYESGNGDQGKTDELLFRGLLELGITNPGKKADELISYINEIETFNPAYGLVKVRDRRELIVKHILDSVAPFSLVHGGESPLVADKVADMVADAGSGAGLPGIPLAICFPGKKFTLIERMGRRAGFLQNCTAVLGLNNAAVEETEIERAAPGRFDLVVFRAFRPLEEPILKALFRLLKPGAKLAAWKGRYAKAKDEMLAAENALPDIIWEIVPVKVPFLEEERCLVVIKEKL